MLTKLFNENSLEEFLAEIFPYRILKDDILKHRFFVNTFISFLVVTVTIILPVVLYGCEAWSLTLREECRLRVFENWILRRIFGPKRDENGEWRRLQNRNCMTCTVHQHNQED